MLAISSTALSPASVTVLSTRGFSLNIYWMNHPTCVLEQREPVLFLLYPLYCYSFNLDLVWLFLSFVLLHFISKGREGTLRWSCSWQLQPHQCSQNTSYPFPFPFYTETTNSFGWQVLNSGSQSAEVRSLRLPVPLLFLSESLSVLVRASLAKAFHFYPSSLVIFWLFIIL